MSNTELLPIRFVARQLRVPLKWLREEALAGRVPALNAGGTLLCDTEAVKAALLPRATAQSDERQVAHAG